VINPRIAGGFYVGQYLTAQESTMNSNGNIRLVLRYLWSIVASFVFLAAVLSLSAGAPVGAVTIGYLMVFGYVILRWNLVTGKIEMQSNLGSGLLRGFVLLSAFVIFAGVSSFGSSEEGKIFAAVIALFMAIETGRQVKRLSTLPNHERKRDSNEKI
jgi:hypothetical protein